MRKKDMLDQNYVLSQKVKSLEFENEGLKHQIKKAEEEIEKLKSMIFTLSVSNAEKSDSVSEASVDPVPVSETASEPAEIAADAEPSDNTAQFEEEPQDEGDSLDFGEVSIPTAIDSDVDYGASVIGKIVVSAANYSNRLTAGGETKYRELVNLILGRTEVAKADILSAVTSDNGFDTKKAAIDLIYEQACEYFESVMAQLPDLDL